MQVHFSGSGQDYSQSALPQRVDSVDKGSSSETSLWEEVAAEEPPGAGAEAETGCRVSASPEQAGG